MDGNFFDSEGEAFDTFDRDIRMRMEKLTSDIEAQAAYILQILSKLDQLQNSLAGTPVADQLPDLSLLPSQSQGGMISVLGSALDRVIARGARAVISTGEISSLALQRAGGSVLGQALGENVRDALGVDAMRYSPSQAALERLSQLALGKRNG